MTPPDPDYALGCRLPVEQWLALNRELAFERPELARFIAPFPPTPLMQLTTGLKEDWLFARHGANFYNVLSHVSPVPLAEFPSLLDFGCGSGRLARLFKGFPGYLAGCDIDPRLVDWCRSALTWMDVHRSRAVPPTPFPDARFAAIVSISIFTHVTEATQDALLAELARIARPDALLFLTTHGERAMARALAEPDIRAMLNVADDRFELARAAFAAGRHAFVLQPQAHLTTVVDGAAVPGRVIDEPYEYGITLVPEAYVRSHWTRWFDVVAYHPGALHDFQDLVVLRPRARPGAA